MERFLKDPRGKRKLSDLTELEKPSVVMMVGIPGSGKSHIAEQLGEMLDISVYSADNARKKLTGDEGNQSKNTEAWKMVYEQAKTTMDLGHSIIIDATHTSVEQRRNDIAYYREIGARAVVGVNVITSLKAAYRRNDNRTRTVPEHAIKRMFGAVTKTPPSAKDGFDFVIPIRND